MKPDVLFLLHLPPPIHGSSIMGRYIKESKLINNNLQTEYINLLASRNVSNSGKISLRKIFKFIKIWFILFGKLIIKRPNVCYLALTATGIAFYKDVLLVALLKCFRVKRIYHLHNKGISIKQDRLIYYYLYKYVFKNAKVILLSKLLYYDIKCFVKYKDVYICPNGIPEIKISDKKISKNKILNLLFLSNLIESKGVFVLLDALAILNKRGLEFECNFVGGEGDISLNEFNKRVRDLNLLSKVFYKGKKYGKEKELFFLKSDIFVFPTFYSNECFPLVLLEALKYGIPIITTNEGAILEIMEDGKFGFLVEKKNIEDLANKIELLIKNEELRNQMSILAQKKFVNNYTLFQYEKRICEIINKI